jgi:glycosyltransferase involved in cell wall biosynthesis
MVYDDASMATVSVIIPTYNRATTLREAIESVNAQDYGDFEIVVVDDGSADNTYEILQAFPEILVVSQNRQGVSAARNTGISQASGRLIAFLDSDDLWLPTKLSTQVAFFDSNPDALICQTEEIWIRNGIRVNPKKRHKKASGMIFERSLELCLVSPSAVMMRSSLFDEVGVFDETLPVCEDYDLWLRVACRFPIYLIDDPLVIKRGGHRDQLSKSTGIDRYRIQALEKIIESGLLSPGQHDAAVVALQEKCGVYAAGCRKRGRIEEAEEYVSLSRRFRTAGEVKGMKQLA